MHSVADLPKRWRERADLLDRHGAAEAASTCRALAAELEEAAQIDADALLTLAEAAEVSNYSERRLRELLADGTIPNAGRPGAPRIRQGDLPRRAVRADVSTEVTALSTRLRGRAS